MTVAHGQKRKDLVWWLFAVLWFGCWHLWHTWSVWKDPGNRVPGPVGDNMVMLWNLGWVKHALGHGTTGFWFSNAYYPDGFLFLFSTHTWLDGVLGWVASALLPDSFSGSVLWANIAMLAATMITGLLVIVGLRTWGIGVWPLLILISSAVTFSWFRMFALTGHYHFYGTQWMLAALVIACLGHRSFSLNEAKKGYTYFSLSGVVTGLAFLNDQTLAVFGGILAFFIIFSSAGRRSRQRLSSQMIAVLCFYGSALTVASIHLVPIFQAIRDGRLTYNLGTTGPRLVDASSLILPPDYHFLGPWLATYRQFHGLQWAEGTYLGLIPMILLFFGTALSVKFLWKDGLRRGSIRRKAEDTRSEAGDNCMRICTFEKNLIAQESRVCFFAIVAAWVFIILALGETLVLGHDSFTALPGRLLKSIPVLNNIRLPQRWIWPAQLCIALGGASALDYYIRRWPPRSTYWILLLLAFVPPLEGKLAIPPVDFRNDSFVRPAPLVNAVKSSYTHGSVLVMPVEAAYAHGNILQFLWGYDIPMTVVYTARMPFSIQSLPWTGNRWADDVGPWLQSRQVTTIVFPFHSGNLTNFQPWLRKAREYVPDLKVFNRDGETVQISEG